MNKQHHILFLALLILFSSCQVMKRRYQSGFYIAKIHPSKNTVAATPKKKTSPQKPQLVKSANEIKAPETLSAGVKDNLFENPTAPLCSTLKSELLKVSYPNGSKSEMKIEPEQARVHQN